MQAPTGVLGHHTAGPATGNYPSMPSGKRRSPPRLVGLVSTASGSLRVGLATVLAIIVTMLGLQFRLRAERV